MSQDDKNSNKKKYSFPAEDLSELQLLRAQEISFSTAVKGIQTLRDQVLNRVFSKVGLDKPAKDVSRHVTYDLDKNEILVEDKKKILVAKPGDEKKAAQVAEQLNKVKA